MMIIEDSRCSDDIPSSPELAVYFKGTLKMLDINRAIRSRNVNDLRALAVSRHGLMEDALRREAWPILLDIDTKAALRMPSSEEMVAHKDFNAVAMDVDRTIRLFPSNLPPVLRRSIKAKNLTLIMRVLIDNPDLHYYQGFHDLCVTVLLVLKADQDLAFRVMNELARTKLAPYMTHSLDETSQQLNMAYPIIGSVSKSLENFLKKSRCGVIFYLSWCITWFAHDLRNYGILVRLFDLFIASDDLMPIYLTASVALRREKHSPLECCSLEAVHAFFRGALRSVDNLEVGIDDLIGDALRLSQHSADKRSCTTERDDSMESIRDSGALSTSVDV